MVLYLKYYRIVQACCKLLGLKYSPRNVSFFSLKKIIYLLAVLGLCCCSGFSLVVASEGYPLAVMYVLLISHCGVQVPGHSDFRSCSSSCLQHWQVDSISLSCQGSPEFLFLILLYVDINEEVIK